MPIKHLPDLSSEEGLKNFLTKVVEQILKQQEAAGYQNNLSPDNKEELIDHIVKTLEPSFKGKNNEEILEDLNKPEFIKSLISIFVVANTLDNKDNPKDEESLLEKLKKIFKLKSESSKEKKDEKELTKEDKENLLNEASAKIEQELSDMLKFKMKPKRDKKEEEKEEKEVMGTLVNLFGQDPRNAGSVTAVVSMFLGNFYGAADYNPLHGNRQIDQDNNPASIAFGDTFGKVREAFNNYIAEGGEPDLNPVQEAVSSIMRPELTRN